MGWKDFCRDRNGPEVCDEACALCRELGARQFKVPDGYVLIPREYFLELSKDAEIIQEQRRRYPIGIPIGHISKGKSQ